MESGYQPVYGELNQPPVLGVPQLGYKPVSNISTSTGAPDKRSWFDRLDKQALEDVAGLATPQRQQGRTLGAPGIGFARAQGGNVPLSKGYEHTYAPNPGLALFVPQKEKNRFAGMS
jgi:hypothetical protein